MSRTRLNLNVVVLLILALTLGGGSVGGAAPYLLPDGMPVATAYAIDGSITGVQSLGKTNPGVLAKIQQMAGANNYREIDINTAKSEPDDKEWVKSAWKSLDRDHPPQWTASGPRGGWKSKALPKTPDEAEKALKGIMRP